MLSCSSGSTAALQVAAPQAYLQYSATAFAVVSPAGLQASLLHQQGRHPHRQH
jgi:hypothetical protein